MLTKMNARFSMLLVAEALVSIVALVSIPEMAFAQAWSFQQLTQQAIATHPSILSKRSLAAAAHADLDSASSQRYPTPSLEASSRGSSGGASSGTLLRIQQPLWAGGRITAGIDAAQSRQEAAESGIDEIKDEVTLKVIGAYVEAIRQQSREDSAKLNVAEHEKLLGLIRRRVTQEVSPSVDRDLAESRLYQAQNELSLVRQALSNALTQLTQLTGKAVERVLDSKSAGDSVPGGRDQALEQAISRSPALQRLAAEERAAASDVASKQAVLWPQLALRYEKKYGQFADEQLMVVLEVQPGAGLSAASGVSAARAREEAARQSRDTALRDLSERISVDWNEFQSAQGRLQNALKARLASAGVSESYARQYTAGRKGWLDVLNAVREATQSEYSVADANAQLFGATLRLRLTTGELWKSQKN